MSFIERQHHLVGRIEGEYITCFESDDKAMNFAVSLGGGFVRQRLCGTCPVCHSPIPYKFRRTMETANISRLVAESRAALT